MDMWSFQSTIDDGIWVSASEAGTNTAFLPRIDVYGPYGVDDAATYADVVARVSFRQGAAQGQIHDRAWRGRQRQR